MARGIDFVIKIDTDVVGGQRGATLNRDVDTIDTTHKASTGEWRGNDISFKQWSVDADGLVVESDAAFAALEAAFTAGDTVDVEMETASGAKYSGDALITSFPMEAPYDDAATFSVSLLGTGALEKAAAPVE